MSTLIISQSEIRRLLPMRTCIGLMEAALEELDAGNAVNPLRRGMLLPDGKGLMGSMPGFLGDPRALAVKIVNVFPGNEGTDLDSHQGVVALFDPDDGHTLAVMDASEVTAIRTAAVSAVATRALSRDAPCTLALIGSGVQARTHLEAIRIVRQVDGVTVFSRNRDRLQDFCGRESERHGVEVNPAESARSAVEGADLICTVTSARNPVVHGEWLRPGCHVNAVGSSSPQDRELDSDAVARAALFVDSRESAQAESGDYLIPLREGRFGEDHIVAELGEVLAGRAQGRRSDEEVTLFNSLGLAVEDVAAAHYVWGRAQEFGLGLEVDLGGRRA
ncbi:MAG: ornithine cyclodeaminase family protein [Gemmatimonadales bacterium]